MTTDAENLIAQYGKLEIQDANEAETRLKLINEVIELLGWTHDDFVVEDRVSEDGTATYADYTFKTANTGFVIEAKRVGTAFLEVSNARRSTLKGKVMTGVTGDAIKQAREYARKLSIPFAVVTNGAQWVIFPGSRVDFIPHEQSSAVIFPNIESVLRDDHDEFFSLLSRDAVISGSLEAELLGRIDDQIKARRLNNVFRKPFFTVKRNSIYPLIETEILTAFTDKVIDQDDDLLEKCYVNSTNKIRFDKRINMHIARRQLSLPQAPQRPRQEKDRRALDVAIDHAYKKIRPIGILVIGRVGAGKTTFLKYTRRVSAKAYFDKPEGKNAHWISVDFLNATSGQSPADYIYDRALDYIIGSPFLQDAHKCVMPAYKQEIEALKRGPLSLIAGNDAEVNTRITEVIMDEWRKKRPYVDRILSYISSNVPVFLVVDNVDQIDEPERQSQVFMDTMSIAQRNGLNAIIAIRDTTYAERRHIATFDAFEFDTVYVDPPDIQGVLSKRFFLTKELLRGQRGEFIAENGMKVIIENKASIIDLVQSSVLGTEVGNTIEVLATGDVRLALRMSRDFMQSGYTATGKAYRLFQSTGRYQLPPHEAMRAIMLGARQIYEEAYSSIGNVFDARLSRTNAQLLRLYVLAGSVHLASLGNFHNLPGEDVALVLNTIGFSEEIAGKILGDLCEKRFVETDSGGEPSLSMSFIPTRLGGHVVRNIMGSMVYLENVLMDTFIASEEKWEALRSLSERILEEKALVAKLALRKVRVMVFFDYMEELYRPLQEESIRRGLKAEWCQNPFEQMRSALNANLKRAMSSATRLYGGKKAAVSQDEED